MTAETTDALVTRLQKMRARAEDAERRAAELEAEVERLRSKRPSAEEIAEQWFAHYQRPR
jgi:hypothetical protein